MRAFLSVRIRTQRASSWRKLTTGSSFISLLPFLLNFFLSLLDFDISSGRGACSGNMLTMFAYAKGRGIRAGSVRGVLPYETSARDSLRSTSYIRAGRLACASVPGLLGFTDGKWVSRHSGRRDVQLRAWKCDPIQREL